MTLCFTLKLKTKQKQTKHEKKQEIAFHHDRPRINITFRRQKLFSWTIQKQNVSNKKTNSSSDNSRSGRKVRTVQCTLHPHTRSPQKTKKSKIRYKQINNNNNKRTGSARTNWKWSRVILSPCLQSLWPIKTANVSFLLLKSSENGYWRTPSEYIVQSLHEGSRPLCHINFGHFELPGFGSWQQK